MNGSTRMLLCLGLAFASVGAVAQTVTGSGTSGTVPVFTGTSTVGNSPIVVSGGNVGIGLASPAYGLDVNSGSGSSTAHFSSTNAVDGAIVDVQSTGNNDAAIRMFGPGGTTGWTIGFNPANNNYTISPGVYTPSLIATDGTFNITQAGNVGLGTTTPAYNLDVVGVARAQAGVIFPDGNEQTAAWTGVLCGGDYAESVNVAGSRVNYEPGDVLVIGSESSSDVAKSAAPYSTLVVGVYSTKPGVVGRRQNDDSKNSSTEVPMAMIGIVPTKVGFRDGNH